MLLAEVEVWHTRPLAPTRRVSLGNLVLPVDPAPGFGGLLLGAVVAGHVGDVDEEMVPDVHRLIDQVDRDVRVVAAPPAPPVPGRSPRARPVDAPPDR